MVPSRWDMDPRNHDQPQRTARLRSCQFRNHQPMAGPCRLMEANPKLPPSPGEVSPVLQLPLGLQGHSAIHQTPEEHGAAVGGEQGPLCSGFSLGGSVPVAVRIAPRPLPQAHMDGVGLKPHPHSTGLLQDRCLSTSCLPAWHMVEIDGKGTPQPCSCHTSGTPVVPAQGLTGPFITQ